MTLVELLVKELHNHGGWPEGASKLCQCQNGDLESVEYEGSTYETGISLTTIVEKCRLIGMTPLECNADRVLRSQYESAISNNSQPEPENKVTRLDILTAINGAVSIKLDDAFELTETLMDAFDIKHK